MKSCLITAELNWLRRLISMLSQWLSWILNSNRDSDKKKKKKKKNLLRLQETGSFKTKLPKKSNMLRSLTPYQQLLLNRLVGGRVVVLGGEECQGSRGETGLLYNGRYEEDVQWTLVWFTELSMYGRKGKISWTRGSYERETGPLYKQ